jgi:hypothetical protein
MPGRVGNFGGVQESFGGDATHVKTGATHLVLLNEAHAHSELTGTQRRGVTAASCTKNDKVKSVLSHW